MPARCKSDGTALCVLVLVLSLLSCVGQKGRGLPPEHAVEVERPSASANEPCRGDADCVRAAGRLQSPHGDRFLISGCKTGGPRSCLALAEANFLRAPEYRRHLNWAATRGCELEAWDACSIAGASYWFASAGVKDLGRAFRYFEVSCARGGRVGCTSFAQFLLEGIHVKADPARAMKILAETCEKTPDGTACTMYGSGLLEGRGVEKDETRAAGLLQRACDLKERTACALLAALYEDGRGVTKDPARTSCLCTRVHALSSEKGTSASEDAALVCPLRRAAGR